MLGITLKYRAPSPAFLDLTWSRWPSVIVTWAQRARSLVVFCSFVILYHGFTLISAWPGAGPWTSLKGWMSPDALLGPFLVPMPCPLPCAVSTIPGAFAVEGSAPLWETPLACDDLRLSSGSRLCLLELCLVSPQTGSAKLLEVSWAWTARHAFFSLLGCTKEHPLFLIRNYGR